MASHIFHVTRVDRRRPDLNEHFSLARLRFWVVRDRQDAGRAVSIELQRFHIFIFKIPREGFRDGHRKRGLPYQMPPGTQQGFSW